MRLHKSYLFISAVLVLIAFVLSIYLYPEWKESWWLLIVAVVIGVVGFVANFRQAFESKEEASLDTSSPGEIEINKDVSHQAGAIDIERARVVGDILASTKGDTYKIGTQITGSTISFNQASFFRPGSAPPRPALVIGRNDDIDDLKKRLRSMADNKGSIQVLTAIKGWPGVGKTTVASALAYDSDITIMFPDGVLWTSLGQNPNTLSEMAIWGRAMGTDEILKAMSVEEAHTLMAGLLRNKRMLLIIDDVWKVESAAPFLVGGPGSATLITTRLDNVAAALAPVAANVYRLKVLKDEDALELLRQLAPDIVNQFPKECLVLVHELEGLPLALQVAGRLLNTEANYGFDVPQLINELREGAKLLESIAPADLADIAHETTPTVAALLQKSLGLLNDEAKYYYAFLGSFAPKPATFDVEAMKFVWQTDDPKPIIKILVDRGLLEYVPEISRYQIHTLLVMLAKSLLN